MLVIHMCSPQMARLEPLPHIFWVYAPAITVASYFKIIILKILEKVFAKKDDSKYATKSVVFLVVCRLTLFGMQ